MPHQISIISGVREDEARRSEAATATGSGLTGPPLLDSPAGEVSEWFKVPLSKSGVR